MFSLRGNFIFPCELFCFIIGCRNFCQKVDNDRYGYFSYILHTFLSLNSKNGIKPKFNISGKMLVQPKNFLHFKFPLSSPKKFLLLFYWKRHLSLFSAEEAFIYYWRKFYRHTTIPPSSLWYNVRVEDLGLKELTNSIQSDRTVQEQPPLF